MTPKTVAVGAELVALVLVSAAANAPATADWMSGNELKESCHSEGQYGRGACLGFTSAVAGIVDTETIYGWRACIPDGVTRGQLRDIMVKFLDDHPEKLHHSAASLAARAYEEVFPCPK